MPSCTRAPRRARAARAESASALAQEAERLSGQAVAALDRSLAAQTRHIAQRTDAQLRLGEGLRRYIEGVLLASFVMFVGLFLAYHNRLWLGRLLAASDGMALISPDFGRPDGSTSTPFASLVIAGRGPIGFAVLLFDLTDSSR
jgi:hypothetical protein